MAELAPFTVEAAGNRFALFDQWRDELPRNPVETARTVCAEHALDGLLLLKWPRHAGACRMVIYNADGSRPEACGNGVRCVAMVVRERGYAKSDRFAVETDSGPRPVEVLGERSVRASMGRPRIVNERVDVRLDQLSWTGTTVDVGNPHCVLFVADLEQAPVAVVGHRIERHGGFANGTNVEFVQLDPDPRVLRLRVWERGVGETESCGTGIAAAVAATAHWHGRVSSLSVITRGGKLEVEWDDAGEVWIAGRVI